ncbi:hypothetical protein, partial [Methylophaga sp.]|uniref:hypothetical protein n=1 Tax=Methylophaga sp. TaxID=2024840 RepID=UPI003F69EE19
MNKNKILAWILVLITAVAGGVLQNWLTTVMILFAAAIMYLFANRGHEATVIEEVNDDIDTTHAEILSLNADTAENIREQIASIHEENNQIASLIHGAIAQLSESFQGLNTQMDAKEQLIHSLIDEDENGH